MPKAKECFKDSKSSHPSRLSGGIGSSDSLRDFYAQYNSEGSIIMSDRDNGIADAVARHLFAHQAHCCQHLADNVQSRYGLVARSGFWKIARAKNEAGYEAALSELWNYSSVAAEYVADISLNGWARCTFLHARHGHNTSNHVEGLELVSSFLSASSSIADGRSSLGLCYGAATC